MASDSQANAKRKRLAAKKLMDRALRNDKDAKQNVKRDQPVAFGVPANVGSKKSELGAIQDAPTKEENSKEE